MRQLRLGDDFGDYVIEAVAGRGGMGLVYRARQRRPERVVAIKVVAPDFAADPAFRVRFEQESTIAAQIEHPNVIPVYAVGETDGLLYIAMRFVEGVDLGRLLASSGALRPQRATRLVAQAADALDAAHARGLVHRDVKPGNMLVAAGDHLYLTDFGLTKRTADSKGMTATGMFVGTVDYIAPEQIEGRDLDARADVYALGCVLYELLAGSVPFPRQSEIAKLFAHVNDPPPPLGGVPEPLAAAVSRAMAKRPADRFTSAGDLGRAALAGAEGRADDEIGRTVATGRAALIDQPNRPARGARRAPSAGPSAWRLEPTQADSPPATDQAAKPRPRRSWIGLAGAVTLLGAVGAAVAIALGASGATRKPQTTPAASTTGTRAATATNSTRAATATTGTHAATATNSTQAGTSTAPQPTATAIFSPVNGSGQLAVQVQHRTSGACFSGSELAIRSDAWRCMVDNVILDPCFTVDQSHVLCPTDGPWGSQSDLLSLPGGVPTNLQDSNAGTSGQPWALQLADGSQCLLLGGATTVVAGQRLNYDCANGLALYGNVQRSGQVWMIYAGTPHSAQLTLRPVATAWF